MSRVSLVLGTWALVATLAAFALFLDNRFLAGFIEHRISGTYVEPRDFAKLVTACEQLTQVNKIQAALVNHAERSLEELDAQRKWNREAVSEPRKKRQRNDKVRRVAKRADEGGTGGGAR